METTDERRAGRGVVVSETVVERARARRELTEWQAQLAALGATIAVVTVLVLLFVLLTGTL